MNSKQYFYKNSENLVNQLCRKVMPVFNHSQTPSACIGQCLCIAQFDNLCIITQNILITVEGQGVLQKSKVRGF